jgi:hypothetical protein
MTMAETPQTPPPASPTRPEVPPAPDTTTAPPRKKRGIFKWVLLVLLLIVLGGGAFLYINLNRIVRATVEKQSAASLNVPTTLGGANVSLFGGDVSLSDFTVGSPAGFDADRMLSLGEVNVTSSISDLRSDPVRMETIEIVRPRMVIEMKGKEFNVKKFIDSLPQDDPTPPEEEKPMKLIIDKLKVTGAEVVFRPDPSVLSAIPGLDVSKLNIKSEYNLQIPPLELNNIGTAEGAQNGAAIKDVATLLVTQLAAKAAESEQIPPELRGLLSGNVSDMINAAKAKLGEEVNKQVGKITADLKEKIGGELGESVGQILSDPNKLKQDPGKAIQEGLGGLINRQSGGSTTQPATKPDAGKAIEQGLGNLLNRQKRGATTQPR